MLLRYARIVITTAAILLLSLVLYSCSDSSDPGGDGTGNDPGCDEIETLIADAESALEDKLFLHLQDYAEDPEAPDDVDFTGVLALYEEAYDCDSANLDARMGLVVTSLLALSKDPEVNAAFEEWETYLENNTPFETSAPGKQSLGVPLVMASGGDALALPFDLVMHSLSLNFSIKALEANPSIARVMDIISGRVIPKLDAALSYLGPVVADENYTFTVTPRMQGDADPYGDTQEIDHTDVLVLRAACQVLMAGCNIATAYDLTFASYDVAGLNAALTQDSGTILELTSEGEARMQAVPGLFTAAIDDLIEGIDSLLGETDEQDDDIIKIGPDDLSQQEVLDMRDDYFPDLREGFEGLSSRVEDWDDDEFTPETELTVNLMAFFDDPIDDFKAMAPPYEFGTAIRGWEEVSQGFSDDTMTQDLVDIPTDGMYWASAAIQYEGFEESDFDFIGNELFRPVLESILVDFVSEVEHADNWSGRFYLYLDIWEDFFAAGPQTIPFEYSGTWYESDTLIAVPVITWEADTYAEWVAGFPDPTMNGLLPGITDAGEVLEQFGVDENDWEKELIFDWSDSGSSDPGVPPPPPLPSW